MIVKEELYKLYELIEQQMSEYDIYFRINLYSKTPPTCNKNYIRSHDIGKGALNGFPRHNTEIEKMSIYKPKNTKAEISYNKYKKVYVLYAYRFGSHGYKDSPEQCLEFTDQQELINSIKKFLESSEEKIRMKIQPYQFCEPPNQYVDGGYKQDHCVIEANCVEVVHLKKDGILSYDLSDPQSTNLWYKIRLLVRLKDYFTSGQLIYNGSVYYPLKGSKSPGQNWAIAPKFNSKHFKAGSLNTNDQKILSGLIAHYNDQVKNGGKV